MLVLVNGMDHFISTCRTQAPGRTNIAKNGQVSQKVIIKFAKMYFSYEM